MASLWLEAIVVGAMGTALGYGAEHALAEALLVAFWAVVAGWNWPVRWQKAGLVAAGSVVASAVILHLTEGALVLHGLFFIVPLILALYRHPFPLFVSFTGTLVVYAAGLFDPHSVYGHDGPGWVHLVLLASVAGLTFALATRVRPRPHSRQS